MEAVKTNFKEESPGEDETTKLFSAATKTENDGPCDDNACDDIEVDAAAKVATEPSTNDMIGTKTKFDRKQKADHENAFSSTADTPSGDEEARKKVLNKERGDKIRQNALDILNNLTSDPSVSDSILETKLANQLKQQFCDGKEKETNPKDSAKILHKLGLLYLKKSLVSESSQSNNKESETEKMLSLIRSVCLMNAAISRQPDNVRKIESDLKRVCDLVLNEAGASDLSANLIAASKKVKKKVISMRTKTNKQLHKLKMLEKKLKDKKKEKVVISSIKGIQDQISVAYIEIMAGLLGYCKKVMGNPPCNFALVGMGSLARKEITPYSDFEHIIVLEKNSEQRPNYESVLTYFRWLSVIFQIVLINLQETIIPSVDIDCFKDETGKNWFFDAITTRGICFDGMMPHACKFPLGRMKPTKTKPWTTELIKSLDEMLKYLALEEDYKNGYHLRDILSNVCYVRGDRAIFENFQQKAHELLSSSAENQENINNIKEVLIQDCDSFATKSNLFNLTSKSFNIKKDFYRSLTIFISALGQIHNIHKSSCFDIAEALAERGLISEKIKHQQMYAVALACKLRLNWYMKQKRQDDIIKSDDKTHSYVQTLLSVIDASDVVKYFQIAYALQCDVSEKLNLMKIHFYSDATLLNCYLYYRFGQYSKFIEFARNYEIKVVNKKDRLQSIEKTMKQLEQKLKGPKKSQLLPEETDDLIFSFGSWFKQCESYDDAKDLFLLCLDIIKKEEKSSGKIQNNKKFQVLYEIGNCYIKLNAFEKAITFFEECLKIKEKNPNDTSSKGIATLFSQIGECLMNMQKLNEAKNYFEKSLEIDKKASLDLCKDGDIAQRSHSLASCLMYMQKPSEAKPYLERSLKIFENTSLNLSVDQNVGKTLYSLGNCLMLMQKPIEAIQYFERSFEIDKKASPDLSVDQNIAKTLHGIGICLIDMKKPSEAKPYLERSLKIFENTSLNLSVDRDMAKILYSLGKCLMNMQKPIEAQHYFERSLKIFEKASFDLSVDRDMANTLHGIGICLIDMKKPSEAKQYFERILKIEEKASLDLSGDVNLA